MYRIEEGTGYDARKLCVRKVRSQTSMRRPRRVAVRVRMSLRINFVSKILALRNYRLNLRKIIFAARTRERNVYFTTHDLCPGTGLLSVQHIDCIYTVRAIDNVTTWHISLMFIDSATQEYQLSRNYLWAYVRITTGCRKQKRLACLVGIPVTDNIRRSI